MRLLAPVLAVLAAAAPVRAQGDSITAWCRELESALAAGESWPLTTALRRDDIVTRARQGLPARPDLDAATLAWRERLELGREICEDIQRHRGRTRVVRITPARPDDAGGERVAVLRWTGQAGLQYLGLVLRTARTEDGDTAVHVTDIYFHRTAEWMSEGLRRRLIAMVGDDDAARAGLRPEERRWLDRAADIASVRRRYAAGDHAGGRMLHAVLPREVRDDPRLLLERLDAALASREAADVDEALADYRKAHPADIAADLRVVAHRLAERGANPAAPPASAALVDSTLAAIDRIERVAGADPYLDVWRAEAELMRDGVERATTFAERAITAEPELEPAHWAVLWLAVRRGDHARTAEVLDGLATRFGAPLDRLIDSPELAAFAASEAGRAWAAARRPR